MTPCIYILKSLRNERYYIGSTTNIERRLREHISGKSEYTRNTGPYLKIFCQDYPTIVEARKIERWLKTQKSRKLIEEIIKSGSIEKKF